MKNIKAYIIRLENVMLMHETILSMNNENAYFSWIYHMPDEPTIEDFNEFAEDEEEYIDIYLYFTKLFERYIKSGLFRPTEEVVKFANRFGIPFQIYE